VKHSEILDALAKLFAPDDAAARDRLAAIAAALDDPEAAQLLSAGCRAVALRSLIAAASQTNNAEAARRAAMTLLERFDAPDAAPALDDPQAIQRTRALLERAAADIAPEPDDPEEQA
jgi:hypothetical protein